MADRPWFLLLSKTHSALGQMDMFVRRGRYVVLESGMSPVFLADPVETFSALKDEVAQLVYGWQT